MALLPLGPWRPGRCQRSASPTRSGPVHAGRSTSSFGRRAGAAHGGQITALGTVIGALIIVPDRLCTERRAAIFLPAILPAAVGVAVLSSALPYSLEMFAMPRIPTRTFGVLMSLNPALGAVAGLIFLGEMLTLIQWAAIASIVAASAGSAATRDLPPN